MPVERMEQCYFCKNGFKEIDYKDVETLKKFLDTHSRISRRRQMRTCARHQRKLAKAVKHARHMALIPFVSA